MNTKRIDWSGEWLARLHHHYLGLSRVSNFLTEAGKQFDLGRGTYQHTTAPFEHIPNLTILREEGFTAGNGLYIACSIPLGLILFQEEGYKISGIDVDEDAMDFGKKQGVNCINANSCRLHRHFQPDSLDFTVSRNFKRRDYLTKSQIVKTLRKEYEVLRSGGVSLSSTYVWDSYLNEDMETLYAKTPFKDITRYLVYVSQLSKNGDPTLVVDILRKD